MTTAEFVRAVRDAAEVVGVDRVGFSRPVSDTGEVTDALIVNYRSPFHGDQVWALSPSAVAGCTPRQIGRHLSGEVFS